MSLIALWLIVALVAGAVEVLVPAFGFVFVSVAALVGAAVAAIGLAWPLQVALFAITLVLSLVLLRPLFTRKLGGRGIPSRTEALIGRRGQLIQAVDPVVGTGRVNVGGEDWAARSGVPIPVGAEVVVEGADGIVLIVGPVLHPASPA
jgi:membrane protein implicated in regulation of membrane protease activity